MSKILEQDSGSSLDITSSASVGSVTPSRSLALAARLKLTSLNAAAATFTLRLEDASGFVLASLAVPKDTAADTTAYLYIDVPLVKSGEAVTLKVKSSNSSDTSATWETEWIDADWVNAGLLSADVDSTGTETITAAKAIELLLAGMLGKIDADAEAGESTIYGRDASSALAVASWPVHNSRDNGSLS